jgi:hypothetical protein
MNAWQDICSANTGALNSVITTDISHPLAHYTLRTFLVVESAPLA